MGETYNEKAMKRYEMIAPLLNEALDATERRYLSAQIRERYGVSDRTLRRHVSTYKRGNGLESLKDGRRADSGRPRKIRQDVVDEAVKLREELPTRSIRRIIAIMEGERLVRPGEVSRTTLNSHLVARGMGAGQLRAQGKAGTQAHRRFQRIGRNALWQADIKYGPTLETGGKKHKTYLIAFIDHATRMIMHSEFYDNQRLPILEDCFRKALLKFGKPVDSYVDNGKIFVSKWFMRACACLQIRHLRAKPYHPASKGCIEKFNQYVDQFLDELSLEPAKTLESLNKKYRAWLEEGYIHKPHSALKKVSADGSETLLTPWESYNQNPAKVRYASSLEIREAFMWEETRKVDRSGCFKLCGTLYDAGVDLIGRKIDVRYDPFDTGIVEIWHQGAMKRKSEPLQMPEFLPWQETANPVAKAKATHSRLLKVYSEQNKAREKARGGAVSFKDLAKEAASNG
jgi:transposase InsO family protein